MDAKATCLVRVLCREDSPHLCVKTISSTIYQFVTVCVNKTIPVATEEKYETIVRSRHADFVLIEIEQSRARLENAN